MVTKRKVSYIPYTPRWLLIKPRVKKFLITQMTADLVCLANIQNPTRNKKFTLIS